MFYREIFNILFSYKDKDIGRFSNLHQCTFKDIHWEKAPSNETPTLSKSMNMDIWVVGTSNQLFIRGLKPKQNFRKTKLVTGKTPFFVIGPFYTLNSICLNIGFWQRSFIWKYCVFKLSTFKVATKKLYSSFLKKKIFQKICFRVEVLKTLKISSDWHIKTCQSLKRRAILKIPRSSF